jgi:DNA-binding response OmpR family regulator
MTVAHRNEVSLIRWPADSSSRERCHSEGRPRILVVEAGVRPPVCSDQLEDWVRAPISRADLTARVRALEARVGARSKPQVDPSGLVAFNEQSLTVSLMQAELLDELAKQFGSIVSRCLLERRLARAQMRRPTRNSLDLHIMRLRRNIRPLGLVIGTAWGRGYMLDAS